ncbi:hypothetical protein SHKM778_24550 [Streptomyces sp. KM77-8]|uniref:Secreted protein n=1 Tax=Streptomyces haneummycinicus TaxID=3074435 RepID=A0AAT9HF88_9ACTN
MPMPESDQTIRRNRVMSPKRTRLALSGVCTAIALVLSTGGTAHANADDSNLFSIEACGDIPGRSAFKFTIHYNSGQNGAWRNIGYSVYDFNALKPGGSSSTVYKLKFCSTGGASSPPAGAGTNIKNNAASGENFHYKYWARVYFRSGHKGAQDVMAPYQHIDRFRNVYNDNASFKWTS